MLLRLYRFHVPRGRILFLMAFLIVLATLGSAAGQTRPANPDSALQSILEQLEGTPLALENAVQQGLKSAAPLQEAEAAYLAARGAVRREKGIFDPELFFSYNYLDEELPSASFFAGAAVLLTRETAARAGLRWSLPIGTEVEAAVNTVRLKTNSRFAFLNPQYNAFGSLSLRQPLLGGFAASARKQLTSAEQNMNAAKARYDQAALGIRAEVESRYWDLYAAERDYAVQKLTRDRAAAFLRETELRARTGLIGPNQVANARTFLAEQELLLLNREEDLDRLSDQLAALIGLRPEAGKLRFIAIDDPPADFPLEPVESLVQRALEDNYDLAASKQQIESARTLANAARWEALPSVDLVGSMGGSGLSGTAQDVIFNNDTLRTGVSGGMGEAISQAVSRDYPNWSVGVEVSIPIGLRSGLGEKERLKAEVIRAEQRYINQARTLEERVRSAYRELYNGRRRLEAAREGVDAAQEQVRIGLIEFSNGRSTAFELVRLGADFAVAQQRYSQALVRTAKAAATLRQLTSGGYPALPQN